VRPGAAAHAGIVAAAAAAPYVFTLGLSPAVGLHVAASLLVLALGRALAIGPLAAAASGVLFAVHPVHVEVLASPSLETIAVTALVAAVPAVAARLLPRRRWITPALLAVGLALGTAHLTRGGPAGVLDLLRGLARALAVLAYPRALVPGFASGAWPADVELYLWSVPFSIAGVAAVKAAASRIEPGGMRAGVGRLVPAVGSVLLVVFAIRGAVYARAWRSDLTLATEAVRVAPGACPAHERLGAALLAEGRREEALQAFAEAATLGAGTPCGEAAGQAIEAARAPSP